MRRTPRTVFVALAALAAVVISTVPAAAATAPATWWKPAAGATWQMQFTGVLDQSVAADVYDIDGADATRAQVTKLHAAGRKVLCYVDAGSWENWRADAARFPAAVRGKALDGWAGEQWLDIRQWDTLRPILADRFATCRAKGFDAVDPDNMDGYANASGFPLTATDQLLFNRRVADLAHSLGLAVGLKNDLEQITRLQPSFDFAVNESCVQWKECALLSPFVTAGKPVFHVEYKASLCPTAANLRFSSIRKNLRLDAFRATC
ncbi:endo alpha-1,4 polygalactosaminidase [Dactylosporangium siamense]|uniref:Endo alpha-1,4 polygalactosaminidase n=1 Tax=Dactylosporangium siamense TaxID=685454 RepID=A0A919PTW0_9ACTN|nr:endo alpha-1,4 polygalactosaminidase [Dactylosporangium siamense]GIG50122.1 endo alpha-1,4 polygalactosaminidase [Dactylosporangium siamense]